MNESENRTNNEKRDNEWGREGEGQLHKNSKPNGDDYYSDN